MSWGGYKFQPDAKSSSYSLGGYVSKPVMAGNVITQAQELVAPAIKFAFPLTAGMSIGAIKGLNGSQMIITTDTGQKYAFNGAFHTKDPMIKAGSGANVSVEASGQPGQEILS